jgi:hypothetical protein
MNEPKEIAPGKTWPRSVQLFVAAYLLSTAFSAVNSILQIDVIRRRLIDVMQLGAAPVESWAYAFIAVRTAISLGILVWAIRRRSMIARLLIGVQFAGWMYGLLKAIGFLSRGNYAALPFVVAALFSAVAVACLLASPSRQWFSRKGSTHADDVDSFS